MTLVTVHRVLSNFGESDTELSFLSNDNSKDPKTT